MVGLNRTRASLVPHVIAAAVALGYAWLISGTALRTTGMQFVMPALFVIAAHVVILAARRKVQPGFSQVVLRRSFGTAVFIVVALSAGSVFAPKPAHANVGEVVGGLLGIVFCGSIIAAVVFALISVMRFIVWGLRGGLKVVSTDDDNDDDNDNDNDTSSFPRRPKKPLFDLGSLLIASVVIGGLSLEGLPKAYSFASEQSAVSTRVVHAPAADVWEAMQTATSPAFALPAVLDVFPRPVAVLVDEGVALGANRVVRIEGREGAGDLRLRVVERTPTTVVFEVLSDTSPVAGWVGFEALTYQVVPNGEDTTVSVRLDFERKLAPAWFFNPMMRGAAYLAADVLARDVVARAEIVDG